MMDYEKKYNEALERFKSFKEKYYIKDTNLGDVIFDKAGEMQKDFNNIFPELRESEDEEIRQQLLWLCGQWEHNPDGRTIPADIDNIRKIRNWLKKQKEQKHYWKPTETDVALFNKAITTNKALTPTERAQLDIIRSKFGYCRAINCRGIVQDEQKPIQSNIEKEYIRTIKSLIADFIRGKRDIDAGYYQKIYDWLDGRHIEQKPTEWDERDENIRKQLISICNEWLGGGFNARPCLDDVRWLKNLLEKQKEQKPVDYDHEMWKNCVANFEGGKKEVIEHPEKYGLQKLTEWSEEDEKMIDTIVSVLGQYIDYKAVSGTGTGYATPRYSKEIDWLKSLRLSWKPSEEQMNCLCAAVDAAIRRHNESVSGYEPAKVLKSLYEDLKKL